MRLLLDQNLSPRLCEQDTTLLVIEAGQGAGVSLPNQLRRPQRPEERPQVLDQ